MSTASSGYNAQTGTMDFSLALVEIKRGCAVRREAWPKGTWIGLHPDREKTLCWGRADDPDKVFCCVTTNEDLFAMDWEVFFA